MKKLIAIILSAVMLLAIALPMSAESASNSGQATMAPVASATAEPVVPEAPTDDVNALECGREIINVDFSKMTGKTLSSTSAFTTQANKASATITNGSNWLDGASSFKDDGGVTVLNLLRNDKSLEGFDIANLKYTSGDRIVMEMNLKVNQIEDGGMFSWAMVDSAGKWHYAGILDDGTVVVNATQTRDKTTKYYSLVDGDVVATLEDGKYYTISVVYDAAENKQEVYIDGDLKFSGEGIAQKVNDGGNEGTTASVKDVVVPANINRFKYEALQADAVVDVNFKNVRIYIDSDYPDTTVEFGSLSDISGTKVCENFTNMTMSGGVTADNDWLGVESSLLTDGETQVLNIKRTNAYPTITSWQLTELAAHISSQFVYSNTIKYNAIEEGGSYAMSLVGNGNTKVYYSFGVVAGGDVYVDYKIVTDSATTYKTIDGGVKIGNINDSQYHTLSVAYDCDSNVETFYIDGVAKYTRYQALQGTGGAVADLPWDVYRVKGEVQKHNALVDINLKSINVHNDVAPENAEPIETLYRGVQESAVSDGMQAVRFVGAVDSLEYSSVGFDISCEYSAVEYADANDTVGTVVNGAKEKKEFSVTEVYRVLTAYGEHGIEESIEAKELGGKYAFAVTIYDIPATGTVTFTVNAYSYSQDGVKTPDANSFVITYTNGAYVSTLIK